MNISNIRQYQRFACFNEALIQLDNAVELSKQRSFTQLVKQGVHQHVKGPKDTTHEAFKAELIADGE